MARDKRRVLFLPNWAKPNPYQSLLAAALGEQGYNVAISSYPKGRLPLFRLLMKRRDISILHLHWIDPWLEPVFWSASPIKRNLRLLLMVIDLRLCRLLGVRTCWTIHNFVSHESKDVGWELRIRRQVARHVDLCFVHSRSALELLENRYALPIAAKTHVVPHASYVEQYPAAEPDAVTTMRHELDLADGEFVYLFLGGIRRYKGLEGLIDAFHALPAADARLAIVGYVFEPEIEAWLRRKAKDDRRIILRIGQVADEDLPVYLSLASVVVLPFSQTLTSGSALLAMSFAKPLILPEAARVYDMPGDQGALYFAEGGLQHALAKAPELDLPSMAAFNRKAAEARTWSQMGALTSTLR